MVGICGLLHKDIFIGKWRGLLSDTFLCESESCRHYINYNMKSIRVVSEDADVPVCGYCNSEMVYSYSDPADYSKPTMLMNKNEKRLK